MNPEKAWDRIYNRNSDFVEEPEEMSIETNAPKDMFEFYDKMDQDDGTEIQLKKSKAIQLEIHKDQIETLQKR